MSKTKVNPETETVEPPKRVRQPATRHRTGFELIEAKRKFEAAKKAELKLADVVTKYQEAQAATESARIAYRELLDKELL